MVGSFWPANLSFKQSPPENFIENTQKSEVDYQELILGSHDGSIRFSGHRYGYSNGGLIILDYNTAPEFKIGAERLSGTANFKLYKVSKQDLLNYLVYKYEDDESSGEINKAFKIDVNQLGQAQEFSHQLVTDERGYATSELNQVELPINQNDTGIWFAQVEINGQTAETMILRSNINGIVHQGDNENIYWAQDFDRSKVSGVNVELVNLQDSVKTLQTTSTDSQGLAKSSVNNSYDIAVFTKDDQIAIAPIHLLYLQYRARSENFSSWYGGFTQRQSQFKTFTFTDRYLYSPGDTVYFKSIVRREDDARYWIEQTQLKVELGTYGEPLWTDTLQTTSYGTIDSQIALADDIEPGTYSIYIKDLSDNIIGYTYIEVANYRKPEAQIRSTVTKLDYLPGQEVQVNLQADYLFGQPMSNQKVRYKVYQHQAHVGGDYQGLDFNTSVQMRGKNKSPLKSGEITLDENGNAILSLPASNQTGFRQFWEFHFEVVDVAGVSIVDGVRVLVHPGEFVIENAVDKISNPYINTQVNIPLKLSPNKANVNLSNIDLSAKFSKSVNGNYIPYDSKNISTNGQGEAMVNFTPDETSSYKLEVETKDQVGNPIRYINEFYISTPNTREKVINKFEITADKSIYKVGDTARFRIETESDIKNMFVSLGRDYSQTHQVVDLSNGQGVFEVNVTDRFQPNIFLYAGTFYNSDWVTKIEEIEIDTQDKQVTVNIKPNNTVYGPGDTVVVDLETVDGNGQPVQTDLAFWVFDKALLELKDQGSFDIFERFWSDRHYRASTNHSLRGISSSGVEGGGGCFTADTLITMADGSLKPISQIKTGDLIKTYADVDNPDLVTSQVNDTYTVDVEGYLIINSDLEITPEHKVWLNSSWQPIGNAQIGDKLLDQDGKEVVIRSIEWQQNPTTVYNLHVDTYHTFIANGIYVHNQKGEPRSSFKDLAYWNPSIQTNQNGQARVSFELPDNLTTWAAMSIAASQTTQVGEGSYEFIVTKDVIVRPVLPSFLRQGDQINIVTVVRNFTQEALSFVFDFDFDAGNSEVGSQTSTVQPNSLSSLKWPTQVTQINPAAKLEISANPEIENKDSDAVIVELPVFQYGYPQANYQQIVQSGSFDLRLDTGTDTSQAQAVINLKPSRFPKVLDYMEHYLSLEQELDSDTNIIYAAHLYSIYGQELGISFDQNLIDNRVRTTVQSIETSLKNEPQWRSPIPHDYEISSMRINLEALILAQRLGYQVDQAVITNSLTRLNNYVNLPDVEVDLAYLNGLIEGNSFRKISLDKSTNLGPERIARALVSNQLNGFTPTEQELNKLYQLAKENDFQYGWSETRENVYRVTTPTVWGLSVSQLTNTNTDKLEKALDYMYRLDQGSGYDRYLLTKITLDYLTSQDQLKPDYNYQLNFNGQILRQGRVQSLNQDLSPVNLNPNNWSENASIRVNQEGKGQLQAELVQTEFFTKRDISASDNPIKLTRTYLSAEKNSEPLKVGDQVIVQFTVEGMGTGEASFSIEDYAPSGLAVIDEGMRNSSFDANNKTTGGYSAQMTTQGIRLENISQNRDKATYQYRARVISEGVFDAPPAVLVVDNDPSLWSRSQSDRLVIDGQNSLAVYRPQNISFEETSDNALGNATQRLTKKIRQSKISPILLSLIVMVISVFSLAAWLKRDQLKLKLYRLKDKLKQMRHKPKV